jgi:hypothetical protein
MTVCLGITVEEVPGSAQEGRLSGPGFAFFAMSAGLGLLRNKVRFYLEEAFAREARAATGSIGW